MDKHGLDVIPKGVVMRTRASFTNGSGKVPSPAVSPTSIASPLHLGFHKAEAVKSQQLVTQEVAQQIELGARLDSLAGVEIEAAAKKPSRGFERYFCCFYSFSQNEQKNAGKLPKLSK